MQLFRLIFACLIFSLPSKILAGASSLPISTQPVASQYVFQSIEKHVKRKPSECNDAQRPVHWANVAGVLTGVCALVSLGPFYLGLAFALSVVSIICSIVGMSNSGQNRTHKGKGWGIFGLVLGSIAFSFSFIGLLITAIFL